MNFKKGISQAVIKRARQLEVLDQNGLPLLVMPEDEIKKQNLRHKIVVVVLCAGENKVYLHKYPHDNPPYYYRLGLSAVTLPYMGEALEDAALHKIEQLFSLELTGLELKRTLQASPQNGNAQVNFFVSAPMSQLQSNNLLERKQGLLVDKDELEGLKRDLPDLLTPGLLWAAEHHVMFA